ncbi:MAG TPA: hypothetical protein VGO00_01545, partial [Kofleriaceae bacterium]|nr:hypothetical protein [Kofleriaceae bacterium]
SVEAAPIDIELVAADRHDDEARPSPRALPIPAAAHKPVATSVALVGQPGVPAATGAATETSHVSLAMRGIDLRLGDGAARDIVRAVRDGAVRSSRVTESRDGTAVIPDGVTTVTVDRDGTAHFHDHEDVDLHWDLHVTPSAIKAQIVQTVRDVVTWAADPYDKTRVGMTQDVPGYLAAEPGACDHWDDACSIELRERDSKVDSIERTRRGTVGHGKLDVTSYLMRHTVGDPFASRKLKLLDDTRDERAERAAIHRDDDLGHSSELMRRNLEQLWRTMRDPAARRQALFQLWDECDEASGPAGEAGQRARAVLIDWIRAKLPRGSPDAYGAGEIAKLSARRTSKQPFQPYD